MRRYNLANAQEAHTTAPSWGGAAVPGSGAGAGDAVADPQITADIYKEGVTASERLDAAMRKACLGVEQLAGLDTLVLCLFRS